MRTDKIIILARKHLGGEMESSARLCLSDAVALYDNGDFDAARARAVKSLVYSLGADSAERLVGASAVVSLCLECGGSGGFYCGRGDPVDFAPHEVAACEVCGGAGEVADEVEPGAPAQS